MMRKMMIVWGSVMVVIFAGGAFGANQTRDRPKDQSRIIYQTGTQDRVHTRDQEKNQSKDHSQTRDRAKGGSCKGTK
jgi:hypothetical protein